jgi:hypothetical protein
MSCWRLRERTIRCLLTDRTIICPRRDGASLIYKTFGTRKCKAHGSQSEILAGLAADQRDPIGSGSTAG